MRAAADQISGFISAFALQCSHLALLSWDTGRAERGPTAWAELTLGVLKMKNELSVASLAAAAQQQPHSAVFYRVFLASTVVLCLAGNKSQREELDSILFLFEVSFPHHENEFVFSMSLSFCASLELCREGWNRVSGRVTWGERGLKLSGSTILSCSESAG